MQWKHLSVVDNNKYALKCKTLGAVAMPYCGSYIVCLCLHAA